MLPMSQKDKFSQVMATIEAFKKLLFDNQPRIHIKDLERRYGKGDRTIRRWIKRKILPKPIRFTGPMWRLEDLEKAEAAGRIPRKG